ncbi:tape measure protein [Azonexus hydrophilus]|uniref:tape measure protein n=1 Tax=Azonexus hydrophilus TaxID=418702 RepID=UPI00048F28A7|nr:tape measure protein [Azonexus hydrophilus]
MAILYGDEVQLRISSRVDGLADINALEGGVGALENEMRELAEAADESGKRQADAAERLERARQVQDDLRLSIMSARNSYAHLAERAKEAGAGQELFARQADTAKKRLDELATEMVVAKGNVKLISKEYRAAMWETKKLETSQKHLKQALRDAHKEAAAAAGNVDLLKNSAKGLAGAMAGVFAAGQLKNYAQDAIAVADAYGQMASRIEKATAGQEEYEYVQQRLLASAAATYRPLAEAQEMYIRTADALRGLNYTTEQALDIGDSFSYLLVSDAASADKASSAINAYTKSIQSGKLEVDAWQSIMAATPSIVDAVAAATGKTTDEVRKLGVTGKLAVRDLNEGLRQTLAANKAVADSMPTTVADALVRLNTVWGAYIGEANRANGATTAIVDKINLLSENLDSVVRAATVAGQVMVAVFAVRALNAVQAYIASLIIARTQTDALTVSTAAAVKQAGLLATAGRLAAAGWIGWEIGAHLKDEFLIVEQLGISLAAGLTKTAARAQTAWEMIKAPFTEDTIDEAYGRLQVRLVEIDNAYAELFAEAERNRQAMESGTVASDAQTAAMGRLSGAASAVAAKLAVTNEELGKMSAADIGNLAKELQEAYQKGEISAGQFAQVNDQIVMASLDRLGVNASATMDRLSAETLSAIADIENLAVAMDGAIYSTENISGALEAAFQKALETAKSISDIGALSEKLATLEKAGRIGGDAMGRLADAAESARQRIEGIVPGIQSVEEAFRSLGIVSDAELKRQADSAKVAYEKIKTSGIASAREIQEAFSKYAERAIDANAGVVADSLRVEAAMAGVKLKVAEAGEASTKAAKQHSGLANSLGQVADEAERAAEAQTRLSGSAASRDGGSVVLPADMLPSAQRSGVKPIYRSTPISQEQVQQRAAPQAVADVQSQGVPNTPQPGPRLQQSTFRIDLSINGRQGTSLDVASRRDADALKGFLAVLEQEAFRSS